MKVGTPNRFSLVTLKVSLLLSFLVHLPGVFPLTNVQARASEDSSASELPRVTVVNGKLELGQTISVGVNHLSEWSADHDPQKLVPFLNGRPLRGLYPEQINLSENTLLFHLKQTPESKKEWADLFHEPVWRRAVSFSVGPENQSVFDSDFEDKNTLELTVIPKSWSLIALPIVLGLWILFGYFATHTDILRDAGPNAVPGNYKPYDLGRVQTAFWFFIISMSYLYLWLVTGSLEILPPSVLALMGITSVTVLGPHLVSAARNLGDQQTSDRTINLSAAPSGNFISDILSDTNGYAFHRFQMALWTIILGVIFIHGVYDDLAMPSLSGSLLALVGISSGTYLGLEVVSQR